MSGATAGLNFETSDIIYKLSNRFSEPIEAAWLESGSINSLDGNNKSIKIYDEDAINCAKYIDGPTQANLNLSIAPFEKVSFIWCDVDTYADEVFKNFEHAPNCEYGKMSHDYYTDQDYLNPNQLNNTNHWKKCTCKAVYYSPIGHNGESPDDYNFNSDFLFADPQGLKDNFTFSNWVDTRGYGYKTSPQFAFFKLDGDGDNPIGWGKGHWKTGAVNASGKNKRFVLKTGRRYTYFRTSLRKDNTSSTEQDQISPYYIVKYAYKELRGFCNTLTDNTNNGSTNCFDMFIVWDISKSQKLSIEQTKNLILEISKNLLTNKDIQIGVIAFNKETSMVTYLTKSYGSLEFYVKNINFVDENPTYRTDILNAFKIAENFLYNEFPKNATAAFDYKELCTSLNNLIVDDTQKSKTLNLPQTNCAKKILLISDGEENENTGQVIDYIKGLNNNTEIYAVDVGLRSYANDLMEKISSTSSNYYSLESYLKEGNGDIITFANILASNINNCVSVVPSWKKAIKNSSGIWVGTSEKTDMVLRPVIFWFMSMLDKSIMTAKILIQVLVKIQYHLHLIQN